MSLAAMHYSIHGQMFLYTCIHIIYILHTFSSTSYGLHASTHIRSFFLLKKDEQFDGLAVSGSKSADRL